MGQDFFVNDYALDPVRFHKPYRATFAGQLSELLPGNSAPTTPYDIYPLYDTHVTPKQAHHVIQHYFADKVTIVYTNAMDTFDVLYDLAMHYHTDESVDWYTIGGYEESYRIFVCFETCVYMLVHDSEDEAWVQPHWFVMPNFDAERRLRKLALLLE